MDTSILLLGGLGVIMFLCVTLVIIVVIIQTTSNGKASQTQIREGRLLPLEAWPFKKNTDPWYVHGGDPDISLVNGALRVNLRKNMTGHQSGGGFKSNPFKLFPTTGVDLSYRVYFPDDFDWSKGGKLPGVCWGKSNNDCATGSEWSTTSGSFRVMWRENGQAIGYAYLALTNKGPSAGNIAMKKQGDMFTKAVRLNQTNKAGLDIWHEHGDTLQFKKGWNTVRMILKMNDAGKPNDFISLTVNGTTNKVQDASIRNSDDVKFNMLNVVVFRGGNGKDWESSRDSYVDLDSFRITQVR